MSPAQRYATAFSKWRDRMPKDMRDPARSTRYWLDHLKPRLRPIRPNFDLYDRTLYGLTDWEEEQARAFRKVAR